MVITISHINYPETHLPRFTPSLFCYSNQLPPFPSFLSLYSQHLPWSVFRSFPHKPVLLFFFFQKNYSANISPCPNNTHASTCHYMIITFPPFKISNSANFPLPKITSPHHDFLPQISRSQHFSSTQFILRQCFSPPPSNFPSSSSPFSFPKFLIIYSYNHSYVIITRIIQFNYSCILSSLTFKYSIIYNTYL